MPDTAHAPPPIKGSLLQGKRGLVMGVANERSLGWGIAAACAAQGAELAFTFQGEALERRVRPLAASVGSDLLFPCDVADDASIDAAFDRPAAALGRAGLPGARHRLRRQGVSARPLPGYAARRIPPGAGHLLLLVRRGGAARRADDAPGRIAAEPDLYRRRAAGRRTTTSWASPRRRWRRRCATWRPTSVARTSG